MSGVRRTLFAIVACSCLSVAPSASAIGPSPDAPSAFNRLEQDSHALPGPLAKLRSNAFDRLRGDLNGIELKLEWQKNGSTGFLRNMEVGEPLKVGFSKLDARSAEAAGRAFLGRYHGLFGLQQNQLSTLVIDRNDLIGKTEYARGIHYVSFVQKVDGIRVHQARVTFALHAETGDLYAVTSNVFGAPATRTFRLTPQQGIQKALSALGIKGQAGNLRRKGDWLVSTVKSGELDGPVSIRKTFLTPRPGEIVPGYVAEVWTRKQGLIEVGVDAGSGRHLLSIPRTSNASYQMSGWSDYPLVEDGTVLNPSLITGTPDTAASPSGWLAPKGADGYFRTVGPNVITFYDWAGVFNDYIYSEAMRPLTAPHTRVTNEGTSSEVVTFDYNAQWASRDNVKDYVQLSIMENFRVLNTLHDRYFKLGFTKEQGNFQDEDPVIVNAQDSYDAGTRNNANFSTPTDGTSGRMNMYVFDDTAGEERDGTMDRMVFAHELGHGLSNRLVNFGDNMLYGAQSGAFGEGMADTFAFMLEDPWSTDPDMWALCPYLGWEYFTYVSRGPLTLLVTEDFANDISKPMGRFTAYTYNIGDEFNIQDEGAQRTLQHFGFLPVVDIGNQAYGNRFVGFRGDWTYLPAPEVHSDGEIWGVATWRAKVRVNDHNWNVSSTDRLKGLEQTFLMGMQLMPNNPNFIQSRDALIIYEEMTQTQPASCMIKYEFARTGMGKYAEAGVDGSYGLATDFDETTETYPEIVTDFAPWGCAPGTYNASTGDPTMIFTAAAPEIEQGKASSLHLQATTPGYNTQATVVGPYIGTVNFASTTDYLDKTVAFTPTNLGNAGFTATVTSSKGDSKTQLVGTLVVTAEELNAAGDTCLLYTSDAADE